MTRRWRHRFAVAALLALLLQQIAIAGHLCAPGLAAMTGNAGTAIVETTMPCHGSPSATRTDHNALSEAGCRQHCDANQTLTDAGLTTSVPALPPAVAWLPVLHLGDASLPARCDGHTSSVDPPPRQRYCSLLI